MAGNKPADIVANLKDGFTLEHHPPVAMGPDNVAVWEREFAYYWLPLLGPTASWLAVHLGGMSTGTELEIEDLSSLLGLSKIKPSHGHPTVRSIARLTDFIPEYIVQPGKFIVAARIELPRLHQRKRWGRLSNEMFALRSQR